MNELHVFAGVGCGILGGMLLGHTTVCAVEVEPFKRRVMLQRQRDGLFPKFPIWDDAKTFDGRNWRGRVDAICAGFPCQDVSVAGTGDGLDGERSGLWCCLPPIIRAIRPRYVQLENSPALVVRGLMRILGEFAEMGYDARWGIVGGAAAKGPCKRERLWLLANSSEVRLEGWHEREAVRRRFAYERAEAFVEGAVWPDVSDPRAFGGVDGTPNRDDRLKAIGDGQIPIVAAMAWTMLERSNTKL